MAFIHNKHLRQYDSRDGYSTIQDMQPGQMFSVASSIFIKADPYLVSVSNGSICELRFWLDAYGEDASFKKVHAIRLHAAQ